MTGTHQSTGNVANDTNQFIFLTGQRHSMLAD